MNARTGTLRGGKQRGPALSASGALDAGAGAEGFGSGGTGATGAAAAGGPLGRAGTSGVQDGNLDRSNDPLRGLEIG